MKLLIVFLFFVTPIVSHAEGTFHIWPQGMLVVNSVESSSESSSFGHTYQLHLGYKAKSKIYFGGTLSGDSIEVTTTTSSTERKTDIERTFKGPTLGYIGTTYYILATYFIDAEYESTPDTGNTSTIFNGDGYQAEIGYLVTKSKWALSFSLVYRSYEWQNSVNGGTETPLTPTQSYSSLQPYLGFSFFF